MAQYIRKCGWHGQGLKHCTKLATHLQANGLHACQDHAVHDMDCLSRRAGGDACDCRHRQERRFQRQQLGIVMPVRA